MTETQERFLRAVLTRVPLDAVVELHLFPPIRRGTLETGVAVIATELPPVPVALVVDAEPEMADATGKAVEPAVETQRNATLDASVELDGATEVAAAGHRDADVEAGIVTPAEAGEPVESVADATAAHVETADSANAPASAYAAESATGEPEAEAVPGPVQDVSTLAPGEPAVAQELASAPVPSPRMRILTAAYRHTIKGVERGKWVVDVQEEADAPLDAVELVLRGVRHRSTEPADPELVSHDTLAALTAASAVAPAA